MDYVKFHRLSNISLLALVTSFLLACGGGGGGGKKETPNPSSSSVSISSSSSLSSSSSSISSVSAVVTTLTLGAPTSNPLITPPSSTLVPVKFLSVVRGSYYPDQLVLDEVDKDGVVVQPSVAELKDDGMGADAFRGDRTYSAQLMLGGVASAEKFYRARADHKGEEVTSGMGRFWVSGCPPIARPSNPEKVVFDSISNANVFADEVLVTLADSVQPELSEINAIMADVQGQVVGCIPALRQYLVEVVGNTTVDELYATINTLKEKNNVVDATPNAVVLSSPENNDQACDGAECQWYLDRIRAPQAWGLVGGGDEQMSVAVIDFGVDCNHPELNCDPSRSSEDAIDHGTGVAGLIAARKGDGSPMVGVAWNTQPYPYSFIGSGGSQYKMSELIALSMAQESVRIINISAATATDPGNQIRDAMCSAIDSGRLVVAAAGNAKMANECQLENIYPARYNSVGQCTNGADLAKGLIVVGAIDEDNNLAQWEGNTLCSNRLYVDIFAPGKNIYTTSVEEGGYASKNGTSFSAPLVAGSAAVLWASQPTLTVAEVHDTLVSSTVPFNQETLDDRNHTTDQRLDGKRLLDVYKAVGGNDDLPSPDLIPNTFTFAARTNVELNTYISSQAVVISDIDAPIPIDTSGGFYSIDNGPFTSAAGTISPNQSVVVQLLSSSLPSTVREATLTIGNLNRIFRVTTAAAVSAQPDDFDFLDVQQADLGVVVLSNALHISGIDPATPISIQGGEYAIEQGEFTSASGVVNSDQNIQIRVTSASIPDATTTATITIGGVTDSFRVTTKPADITPIPFVFTDINNVSVNTQIETNIISVQGINTAAAISISGGEYSIDGGAYRTAASSIQQGQSVQLRHNSANNFGADSFTTLTIGTYSATFRSRTIVNAAPVASNINIIDSNGGNLVVGDNLVGSYSYSDADNDSEGVSTFRWLRNGNPINGATATTYTLTLADSDQSITFEVTPIATTGLLSGVAAVSSSLTITNSAPIVNNILVTDINGAALLVGDILGVAYDFVDADNDAEGNTTYRWLRNGVEIFGATSSSYQVVSDDVGQSLIVEITPVALTGQLVGVATPSASVIVGNTAPQASGVSISGDTAGTSVVGTNLTGIYTFSDVDTDPEGASLYQWFRNGVAIGGATALSYQITAVDSGQTIAFEVTPVAATGTVQGTSIRSGNISINAIPVAQSVAIVDNNGGNLLVGDSLTGTYSYNDAESDAQGASVYRWLRNGSPISGATSTNYVLALADSGQSIRFEVTPVAISGSATGTAVLSSAVAVNNSAPLASNVTIADNNGGGLAIGDVLTGSYIYNDSDGDSEGATTFRWLRNGSQVVSTAQNYALTASDSGQSIAFEVVPRAVIGVTNGAAVTSSVLSIPLYIPNAFSFTPVTGAALSAEVVSNAVNISGINTAVPISIANGQYSINGGAFTSAAGTVTNGQTVAVRVTSSATPNTTTQAALTVGGIAGNFSVTTVLADTVPDAFSFTAVTNAALNTTVTSGAITITGINAAAPISIANGQYSINGGAFTSAAGTITNSQTVTVRVTSSATPNTTIQAALTVGGIAGNFSVTTVLADTTPDAFSFTSVTNAALSTAVTSSAITITGINAAAPISIANGQYAINGGAFTSAAGTITNSQTVTVRVTSSATPSTTTQAALTVGGIAGNFSVTTVLADTVPDAFSFTSVTNAALSTAVTSGAITISGVNAATPISIANGQYAINGGAFTSTAGTVTNGQTVIVRVTSSAAPNTTTQAVLTVGGIAGNFSVTTVLADTTPDAFSFTAVTNAALNTTVTSGAITITGINAAAPISITNGQYAINGGAFTSAAGTITNGQTVAVRVTSSATPNTTTQAALTVGGITGNFSVTTVLADTIPDVFSFTAVTNAALNTTVTSGAITITGINAAAPISITNGQYAINGGAFTNTAGTVTSGQTVIVRVTSSATPNTTIQTALTVGGVVGNFSVTTVLADTTPDAFSFTAVTNAALSSAVTSNAITIAGINAAAPISITNGQYAINGGAFTSAAGTVTNGQTVTVRVTSSATPNTTMQAALTVGGVVGDFSVTTVLVDTTPDAFSFTSVINAASSITVTSNTVTITGIDSSTPISITGGEYSINANMFTASAGTITNGLTVNVRLTTAAASNATRSAVLTIGGVSGTFSATTRTDVIPPTAQVLFPATTSLTDGVSALVRGTASDDVNDVAAVSVNGVPATSLNNFSSWEANVPLIPGINTLIVSAIDGANNMASNAATISVDRQLFMKHPRAIEIDITNNRALVVDSDLRALIAIDLTSGARTVLSSPAIPNAVNPLMGVVGIALDSANNRLLVVTGSSSRALMAVDLTSGARTILSNSSIPDTVNGMSSPMAIALDAINNRALIVDDGLNAMMAIDLTSGVRSILSNNSIPNSSFGFDQPYGIVLDRLNNRALVADIGRQAVVAVNLTTGARTFFSNSVTPDAVNKFSNPSGITLDVINNRALVVDGIFGGLEAVIAVDLTSGARTILSNSNFPNATNSLLSPTGITLDSERNRALVIDPGHDTVIAIDLTNGARTTLLSNSNIPSLANKLQHPYQSTLDVSRNRALVLDGALGSVVSVDLTSGERTVLSDNNIPNAINSLNDPRSIALDSVNNRALVVNNGTKSIIAVNLTSGARTVLSSSTVPNGLNSFSVPKQIVIDNANNRALVTDGLSGDPQAIIAVDLTSGARTILSNNSIPNATNSFSLPSEMAIDTANNRVLVLDNWTLIGVNLTSGQRTILSSNSLPDASNSLSDPSGITLDSTNNRALVVDRNLKTVIAINLTTGVRTVLSNNSTPDASNSLSSPASITLDSARNRALVTDTDLDSVIAVDLVTGARMYLTK